MTKPIGPTSLLAVALVGTLWGLNWPAVKVMLTEIPPLTIRAVAFPSAALLLAIIVKARGQSLFVPKGERLAVAVTGLFLIFGFNVLTSLGQVLVETSKAAIVAYTMPAMTAFLAALTLGERVGFRMIAALGIGMAGLVVLASEDFDALVAAPLGPVIMLGAALSWSIGNVALKSRAWSLGPLALTTWFFVLAALVCWPLVLIFEPPWEQTLPGAAVSALLIFHVLGPMITCYVLWATLLSRLPASVASISVLSAPVVGVIAASALLGDPMTWQKIVSLGLILLSVALALIPARA